MRTSIHLLFALLVLAGSLASCSKLETPPNNALDKGHEEASKVVITLTPGTLSNDSIDHGIYALGFTPDADGEAKQSQITKEEQPDHSFISKGAARLQKNKWYKVKVSFYNKAGSLINEEFTSSETQRNMHQFYFQYLENGKAVFEDANLVQIEYRYGDTFDNGTLIKPAIGFTGYLRVKDSAPQSFKINTILVHVVPPGRKTNAKGEPYPFYNPPLRLLGVTDARVEFDVTTY